MTKGKLLRGCHLVITRRASIILIIISIITLISRGLWRRNGRRSKAADARLSAGNASYPSVHLTYLISEIVKTTTKVSLYPLKLCYDGLEGHTTSCGGRSSRERRRNSRRCRICHLYSWPLHSKLGLASPNRTNADGTHGGEERRKRNRNGEVLKDPHDS